MYHPYQNNALAVPPMNEQMPDDNRTWSSDLKFVDEIPDLEDPTFDSWWKKQLFALNNFFNHTKNNGSN